MIHAVTLDVTRTLIHCPRLGEIYSEVLARHGVAVEPDLALRLIGQVWREMACLAEPARDRFSSHPDGPRGWWLRFLERFCEHLDAGEPSRFAAAELFHCLGRGESWEVYPEVPEVLDALRARGLRLAVISNWDERLPGVLRDLDLARRFDALVYSSAVGVEKPDGRIFRRALRDLGVEPRSALHVGDSRLEDLEGAIAVGMRGLLLMRPDCAGRAGRHATDGRDATAGRDDPVGRAGRHAPAGGDGRNARAEIRSGETGETGEIGRSGRAGRSERTGHPDRVGHEPLDLGRSGREERAAAGGHAAGKAGVSPFAHYEGDVSGLRDLSPLPALVSTTGPLRGEGSEGREGRETDDSR